MRLLEHHADVLEFDIMTQTSPVVTEIPLLLLFFLGGGGGVLSRCVKYCTLP